MGVEEIGGLNQLAGGVVGFSEDHPVLHITLWRDDDQQQTALRQAQKFNVAKHRCAPGCNHHTHKVRQVGQQLRRIQNDFLRLLCRQGRGLELLALHGEHGVDKQAVAPGRGHPACRGVGAGNQAQLLQIGHHIANGGG